MSRVIQEEIKKPLAEEVLFGRLSGGGTVRILLADGKLAFSYLSREDEKKTLPKPAERKALSHSKAAVKKPKRAAKVK